MRAPLVSPSGFTEGQTVAEATLLSTYYTPGTFSSLPFGFSLRHNSAQFEGKETKAQRESHFPWTRKLTNGEAEMKSQEGPTPQPLSFPPS